MQTVEKQILGWRVIDKSPAITRCVVCVAPHTSNWDFVIGMTACHILGRKKHFLMKSDWFVGPLRPLFISMGGIAVDRSAPNGLTETLIERFSEQDDLTLIITPEGTRSANAEWKTGFYRIAQTAKVPLLLASLDYGKREIIVSEPFDMTNNIDNDIDAIKHYFNQFTPKYPDKFVI